MTRTVIAFSLSLVLTASAAEAADPKTTLPATSGTDFASPARTSPVLVASRPQLHEERVFSVLQVPAREVPVEEDTCVCTDGPGPCYRYTATLDVAGWRFVSVTFVVTYDDAAYVQDTKLAFRNFPTEPPGDPALGKVSAASTVLGGEAVLMSGSYYCPSNVTGITDPYFSVYLSR